MAKKSFGIKAKRNVDTQQLAFQMEDQLEGVVILEELRDLIPPLQEEELKSLETSILSEGVREPIILWKREDGSKVIIDGHNRYSLIQKHEISKYPQPIIKEFPDLEEVKEWMLINQMGRRNLTPIQASYVRGELYNRLKVKLTSDKFDALGQNDPRTSERIGEQMGVSEKTVRRDAEFALGLQKMTSGFKRSILMGSVKVNKGLIQKVSHTNLNDISSPEGLVVPVPSKEEVDLMSLEKEFNQKKRALKACVNGLSFSSEAGDVEEIAKLVREVKKLLKVKG